MDLYVLVFSPGYYRQNPLEIFAVYNGGLSIQGVLIAGIIFAVWYTRRTGIGFWRTADAFAPAIILWQAIGRIGCDVFGVPMDKAYPWGVMVGSQLLHPAQLYEALLNLALFTYLWWSRGRTKYDGQLFIRYLIGFSLIRAAIEFFRTNPVVIGPFTVAHVTSLAIITASIVTGSLLKRKAKRNEPDTGEGPSRVSLLEYLIIVAGGAAGTLIYFSIY
ncbi:MAG: Prolipoprotein diacylglyceryl transferase [Firmicutes bacterium]|nr:Prolipoprotein diacylglyceryl transferase [Bacillota bacterium]